MFRRPFVPEDLSASGELVLVAQGTTVSYQKRRGLKNGGGINGCPGTGLLGSRVIGSVGYKVKSQ